MATLVPETNPVEAARRASGVSVLELSHLTRIARTTLQRKLAEPWRFTVAEWLAVCDAIGVDMRRTSVMMREVTR